MRANQDISWTETIQLKCIDKIIYEGKKQASARILFVKKFQLITQIVAASMAGSVIIVRHDVVIGNVR